MSAFVFEDDVFDIKDVDKDGKPFEKGRHSQIDLDRRCKHVAKPHSLQSQQFRG
jgi:hypothetical protein